MSEILILEDDKATAEAYEALFMSRGLTCKVFTRGVDALNWLRTANPKAALLDKRLKELDGSFQRVQGWDVFKFIRAHCPTVPCVIVTAEPDGAEDFQFGALRAVQFCDKRKNEPSEIIDAVCKALSHSELQVRRDQLVMAAEATCYGIMSSLVTKTIRKEIESLTYLCDVALDEVALDTEDSFVSRGDTLQQLASTARHINSVFERLRNVNPRFAVLLDDSAVDAREPGTPRSKSLISLSSKTVGGEISDLIAVACAGLTVAPQIVTIQGGDASVVIDDFFGTQILYLALRVALERVQRYAGANGQSGDPPRVHVDAGVAEDEGETVTVVFKDNGGEIPNLNQTEIGTADAWIGSSSDWLTAQFTTIRALARLHGGEATFESWNDRDGGGGLLTRIRFPNRLQIGK